MLRMAPSPAMAMVPMLHKVGVLVRFSTTVLLCQKGPQNEEDRAPIPGQEEAKNRSQKGKEVTEIAAEAPWAEMAL